MTEESNVFFKKGSHKRCIIEAIRSTVFKYLEQQEDNKTKNFWAETRPCFCLDIDTFFWSKAIFVWMISGARPNVYFYFTSFVSRKAIFLLFVWSKAVLCLDQMLEQGYF